VKTLIQQVRDGQRELKKRIDYEYDLVSGKINRVYYQKGESDQFIHRYSYDGDNRIIGVHTSRDGVVWTQDAAYAYYAHGPLARAIIGDSLEIQDHAYTLQGWMKALNGQYFSYALGYFSGDYRSIGTSDHLATPVATNKDLYNGNIATMASLNPKLSETVWTQQFSYDQLNRITGSQSIGLAHTNAYKTSYSYDANGNIERLQRYNEAGDAFDSLVYHYENRAGGYLRNTNKLRWVDDSPALSGHHAEDLEDQDMDNYRYDDLGNLIYDVQEEIARIEWNVYGKISKVLRTEASTRPDLEFLYDATGNRVAKIVKPKGANATITYYIRDAQGNVLSVYKKSESGHTAELEEQYIYGSSRVGMLAADGANNTRTLGLRSYELTDHLGNVRTVISDKPTALGLTEMLAGYDYYPFGMIARSETEGSYKFGYGGQEMDNEITGISGTHYYAEYWQYDSRLGRRWNVDPIIKSHESVYAAFANNPIWFIDPNGADSSLYNKETGDFIARGVTPEDDKTAIWEVDTNAEDYDPNNPWATATKLLYNVGNDDDKKAGRITGITGDSFRQNHPLYSQRKSITGKFAMEYNTQVYEEDLMDLTSEFAKILFDGRSHFAPTLTGPWKLWFYFQVNDNEPYDLKSTTRSNLNQIPSYAAIVIGEWTLFNGKLTRYDDYGNISYGYWGKLYGFSTKVLLEKADQNQDTKNGKTTTGVGDEPRDKAAILRGTNLIVK